MINSRRLAKTRERAGHSQASLARASGVSQQRISQLEDVDGAKHTVTPPLVKKLAGELAVSIEYLTTAGDLADLAFSGAAQTSTPAASPPVAGVAPT
jgi:transcriptional regulator with XRE-family HTH domain